VRERRRELVPALCDPAPPHGVILDIAADDVVPELIGRAVEIPLTYGLTYCTSEICDIIELGIDVDRVPTEIAV
jgi:hypothetical protein